MVDYTFVEECFEWPNTVDQMKTNALTYTIDHFAEASASCEEAGTGLLTIALGCGLCVELLRDRELSNDVSGEILGVAGHLKCDTAFRKGLQALHDDFCPRKNGTGKRMDIFWLEAWVEALAQRPPGFPPFVIMDSAPSSGFRAW